MTTPIDPNRPRAKVRILLETEDGAIWRVTDWRRIMGKWNRETPGSELADARLFVNVMTGERRLHHWFGETRHDRAPRALTAKLLYHQLEFAKLLPTRPLTRGLPDV